jgi:hypothetical protein
VAFQSRDQVRDVAAWIKVIMRHPHDIFTGCRPHEEIVMIDPMESIIYRQNPDTGIVDKVSFQHIERIVLSMSIG